MVEAFHPLIEAQLAGVALSFVDLVRFDFKSGEMRLHGGFGTVVDGNGERWQGIGNMGVAGPISAGSGQAIEEMTFTLFGDAAMLATLEADAEEAAGREVFRYLQFLDMATFRPIDVPLQMFWGKMGALKVDRPKVEQGGNPAQRSISVTAVNAFVNRRKPAYGFFSHRDQQARASGDNLFINISRMANATARWPDF